MTNLLIISLSTSYLPPSPKIRKLAEAEEVDGWGWSESENGPLKAAFSAGLFHPLPVANVQNSGA